jgi:AraC family transcriptional activator of tynA and feaB
MDIRSCRGWRHNPRCGEGRKLMPLSLHADKQFTRICGIIKDRFADPDFGPSEVAAEAGISLRYLQKLFTSRNSTRTNFIYSVRLDHAGRLLKRRALLNTSQPISEVAYDSGCSRLYSFRQKISPPVRRPVGSGTPPDPCLRRDRNPTSNKSVRASTDESAR